jgi:PAS domain S-box-containing protein
MDANRLNNVSTIDTLRILRQQAEDIVSGQVAVATANLKALSPAVVLKLIHELQVHQIELEMQNEELRKSQLELELTRERYFDLYDLAPISYCTTDELGVILEANLATSELLGEPRSALVGQPISRYISKECQDNFYHCRRLLYATGDKQSCELRLTQPQGEAHWVYLTITAAKDNQGDRVHRVVLTDITEAKIMARAMPESDASLHALDDSHPKRP